MERQYIRGLGDLIEGDVLCHNSDQHVRDYRVDTISQTTVRLSMKRHDQNYWGLCGTFNENSSVFQGQMYVKTPYEQPYNPTQAGDKDDDI